MPTLTRSKDAAQEIRHVSMLPLAIEIAARAHRTQLDKTGRPYILHPIALMNRFEDEPAQIVAVLHDTIEDSDGAVTADSLRAAGFGPEIISGVEAMTKTQAEDEQGEEGYYAFVRRAAQHPIAKRVKLADIEHNLDLRRLGQIGENDIARIRKYHRARQMLLGDKS